MEFYTELNLSVQESPQLNNFKKISLLIINIFNVSNKKKGVILKYLDNKA